MTAKRKAVFIHDIQTKFECWGLRYRGARALADAQLADREAAVAWVKSRAHKTPGIGSLTLRELYLAFGLAVPARPAHQTLRQRVAALEKQLEEVHAKIGTGQCA